MQVLVTGIKMESVRANPKAKRVATPFNTAIFRKRPTLKNMPFLIKIKEKYVCSPLFEEHPLGVHQYTYSSNQMLRKRTFPINILVLVANTSTSAMHIVVVLSLVPAC